MHRSNHKSDTVAQPPASVFLPKDALWLGECGLAVGDTNIASHSDGLKLATHLEVLLAIAFGKRLAPRSLAQIVDAIDISRRGDHARANLFLALVGLSRVPLANGLS